ncbi:MAG: beta-lactamase family protein [Alphaproteobacteria bacterium]|nr:beta-lactamase family protein [Alphaproteobacteria bacterium]
MRRFIPLVLLGACAGPEVPSPDFYACDSPAFDEHPHADRYAGILEDGLALGLPAISVAVRSPEGLWLGAAGEADLSQGIAAEPCHRFYIGSVSKVFGATAALRLVDQGALSLDDPIRDHLPAEVVAHIAGAEVATVRQLLSHRTGFPDYVDATFILEVFNGGVEAMTVRETLEAYVYDARPLFAPGEDLSYSNSNYLLLALILEDVTGQSAYEAVHTLVTEPAGLTDSWGRSEGPTALVRGYGSLRNGALVDHSEVTARVMSEAGKLDGGVVSTPADMVALLDALDTLLEPETLTEMQDATAVTHPDAGLMDGYGLGLMRLDTDYGPAFGHYGGVWPFAALAYHFPEQDTTVAVSVSGEVEGVGAFIDGPGVFEAVFGAP